MADSKITALATLTAADPVNDMFPVVDVSDTSMAASGTTKRISANNILSSSPTASGALTVTGLVTAGSATITGAATVGTTLGVTGASSLSGVVTVSAGATTPLDLTNAAVTTERQIKIENSSVTAYLGVEPAAGGRFIGSAAGNAYFGTNVAYGLEFATNNNVRMTLNTTGNLAFKSGLGIDFTDASNAAGMTSELLNDYEEGTFTPNIGGTATYTTQVGTYTKIGNRVYVSVRLVVLLAGTGEDFRISGLPFSASAGQFGLGVGYFQSLKTNAAFLSAYVNGTQISMTGTTVSTASITNNMGVIGNGTDLMISGFYIV